MTADLGGQVLVPGVYRGTTLAITGTLTLDAQGDPDAVFIFQTTSTLITAPASRVLLINGAQPCNVFWQVGSSATLGTHSVFVGSTLALTSVTANAGATVVGRLLARNGSVTLDRNTVTRPMCTAPATTSTTVPTTTTTVPGTTTTSTMPATTTTTVPRTTSTTATPGTTTTTPAAVGAQPGATNTGPRSGPVAGRSPTVGPSAPSGASATAAGRSSTALARTGPPLMKECLAGGFLVSLGLSVLYFTQRRRLDRICANVRRELFP